MRRDDDNTIRPTGIPDFWERYDDAIDNGGAPQGALNARAAARATAPLPMPDLSTAPAEVSEDAKRICRNLRRGPKLSGELRPAVGISPRRFYRAMKWLRNKRIVSRTTPPKDRRCRRFSLKGAA